MRDGRNGGMWVANWLFVFGTMAWEQYSRNGCVVSSYGAETIS